MRRRARENVARTPGIDEPQAQRLKRVFQIDVETWRACGGAVRIIACIEDRLVIGKILTHLDNKSQSVDLSRLPPCRGPPQSGLLG